MNSNEKYNKEILEDAVNVLKMFKCCTKDEYENGVLDGYLLLGLVSSAEDRGIEVASYAQIQPDALKLAIRSTVKRNPDLVQPLMEGLAVALSESEAVATEFMLYKTLFGE
jgi:hypothetical protein